MPSKKGKPGFRHRGYSDDKKRTQLRSFSEESFGQPIPNFGLSLLPDSPSSLPESLRRKLLGIVLPMVKY